MLGSAPNRGERPLHLASVSRLRIKLDSRALLSSELISTCHRRIERFDTQLRSIIELNPDALQLAHSWDRQPVLASPLAGIPVLLKDNIATADRMATSAGSLALTDSFYPRDSTVAERLRRAGAILLGKTNMSEWSNFRSRRSKCGWSARGGQCRNPHHLEHSPSGSSSGSAAAVAIGLAPLAVGTETVGSIVLPCGTCGIVGLKPTPKLIPTDGIIPIATSWDTAGPMGRCVNDVATLFSVLSDRSFQLRPDALKGARIGVARDCFGFDSGVDQLLEEVLKRLRELGAVLIDPVTIPTWGKLRDAAWLTMLYEFKTGLNRYLSQQSPEFAIRTLSDVIAFNLAHPELEALDAYGQAILLEAESKGELKEPEYLEALAQARALSCLERVFANHQLCAIVGPTNGPAEKIEHRPQEGLECAETDSAAAAAVGGYPHLTVPAGLVRGLPVGFSLIGRRFSEQRLLELGYHYERSFLES